MLSAEVLASHGEGPLGVAVSGGSDSVALLILLHGTGLPIVAATVDHGLRPEARQEVEFVAALCAARGIPHDTLRWTAPPGGNLQHMARQGRQRLLSDWIKDRGGRCIALGHTQDDVAETLLMRLERGSGLDGLSAMPAISEIAGVTWLRPLLDVSRSDLRQFLTTLSITWCDDASNRDTDRFARARIREAMGGLALDAAGLAETASRLRAAREVAEDAARRLAMSCLAVTPLGEVIVARAIFAAAPAETRFRLLRQISRWMDGTAYAPRQAGIEAFDAAIRAGREMTCGGMLVRHRAVCAYLRREPARVSAGRLVWDHRWRIAGTGGAVPVAKLPRAQWPPTDSPRLPELMASVPALPSQGGAPLLPGGAAMSHGAIRLIPLPLLAAPR